MKVVVCFLLFIPSTCLAGNEAHLKGEKLKVLWTDIEDSEIHRDAEELWKEASAAKKKTYNRV